MQCILHIGTEKTGTTLLQGWLYQNQAALSQQGFYLSECLEKPNNRLLAACFSQQIDGWAKRNGISSQEDRERFFGGFREALIDELNAASEQHHSVIISSEHFHSTLKTAEEITALAEFLLTAFSSVRVVCYFRNQFDVAVSRYSTALKVASTKSLDDFIDQLHPAAHLYNYLAAADAWSAAFGREHCDFRLYDRERFVSNDIRYDFLEALGAPNIADALNFYLERANESLSQLKAQIFQFINTVAPYWRGDSGEVNRTNVELKQQILSWQLPDDAPITSPRRAEVEDLFAESNQAFFLRYFGTNNAFSSGASREHASVSRDNSDAIVTSLLRYLLPLVVDKKLENADAEYLRDIALKIESQTPLGLQDALSLMTLAQRARPDGPQINAKVAQWQQALMTDDE